MNRLPTPETDACWQDIECNPREHARNLEHERDEAWEQRDKLVEALKQCREDSVELLGERDRWRYEIRSDYQKRYQETSDNVTRADEAIQSLTPNAMEFRRGLFKLQEKQLNEVRAELDRIREERYQYRGILIRLYNDLFVHHKGEAVREFKELFREENYN